MRHCLLFASGLVVILLLAGCGNKGPLVRPPGYSAAPAAVASTPAMATSVSVPAPASTSITSGDQP